jgi:hypothetical protein
VVHQRLGQSHIAALLRQQHEVQGGHPQAIVFLRYGYTSQAQFGQLLPQGRVAAAVRIPARAQTLGRDFVNQKAAHGIVEQELVFAECKVHGYLGMPSMRSAMMLR